MSLTNTVKELFTSLQQLSRPTLALLAACGSADESQGCRTDYDCREGRVCEYDPQAGERYCSSGSSSSPIDNVPIDKGPVDVVGAWCVYQVDIPEQCGMGLLPEGQGGARYIEFSHSGSQLMAVRCDFYGQDCYQPMMVAVDGRTLTFGHKDEHVFVIYSLNQVNHELLEGIVTYDHKDSEYNRKVGRKGSTERLGRYHRIGQ